MSSFDKFLSEFLVVAFTQIFGDQFNFGGRHAGPGSHLGNNTFPFGYREPIGWKELVTGVAILNIERTPMGELVKRGSSGGIAGCRNIQVT